MTLVGDARNAPVVGLLAGKNKQAKDHGVNEREPGPVAVRSSHSPAISHRSQLPPH